VFGDAPVPSVWMAATGHGWQAVTLAQSFAESDAAGSERVRLVIGALDGASVQGLRVWLRACASRPGLVVEVDMRGVDDRHHITLFALLAESARRASTNGSRVLVLHAPERMAASLTAVGILVRLDGSAHPATGHVVHITSREGPVPPELVHSVLPTGSHG
jgi:hypothetical protein